MKKLLFTSLLTTLCMGAFATGVGTSDLVVNSETENKNLDVVYFSSTNGSKLIIDGTTADMSKYQIHRHPTTADVELKNNATLNVTHSFRISQNRESPTTATISGDGSVNVTNTSGAMFVPDNSTATSQLGEKGSAIGAEYFFNQTGDFTFLKEIKVELWSRVTIGNFVAKDSQNVSVSGEGAKLITTSKEALTLGDIYVNSGATTYSAQTSTGAISFKTANFASSGTDYKVIFGATSGLTGISYDSATSKATATASDNASINGLTINNGGTFVNDLAEKKSLNIANLDIKSGGKYDSSVYKTVVYVTNGTIALGATANFGRNLWVSGTLTIDASNESVSIRKILPQANSKIIFNGENAVKGDYPDSEVSTIASCYTGATVELGANQKFTDLIMSAATGVTHSDLTFNFNGANSISFETFTNEKAGTTYTLYLNDFVNGLFLLKDTSGISLDNIIVNGLYTGSQLSWNTELVAGYNALTFVPEPAEWAVIFGALALVFAIYRRRK